MRTIFHSKLVLIAALASAATLSGAACSTTPTDTNTNINVNTRNTTTATPSPTATPMSGMSNMSGGMDGMNMESSPNAASQAYDLQFLDTMSAHHQSAVDMARPAVMKAQHPELKQFAQKIITEQEREIAEMKRYREQWYAGNPQAMNMEMAGMMDSMKGMDMTKMNAATGNEFDLMFLDMMTPHHAGATAMAREALTKAEHPEIKRLAQTIITAQDKEIRRMNEWRKAWGATASGYAGQEKREIKALSTDEVRAYLRGEGMGLARAAELNRYPGPMHVLQLAGQLDLSNEQRQRTQELREAVVRDAARLGERIVEGEARLDKTFAQTQIDEGSLSLSIREIARLQGELREVHLRAHLAQRRLLTPIQVARYAELRGYGAGEHQHRMG